MPLASSLDFRPLNYDFNGDTLINNSDITALANAVLPIVQRALEPFDIQVVVAAASTLAGIVTTLNSNDSETDGVNDAYSLVVDARSDFYSGGSVGDSFDTSIPSGVIDAVGDNQGLFGIAAADDLFAQAGNDQDEAALTFSDNIFNVLVNLGNTPGTADFNTKLAHRLAYTATHEAFHTFSLIHTTGGTSGQLLMSDGDVIRTGSSDTARENPFIVTRTDLVHQVTVSEPNNYQLLRDDPDIGLRDSDDDGIPDLAYVTGTGAFDKITLDRDSSNPNVVHVTVAAHSNATFTSLIQQETYDINLTTDTEGEILIDSSLSNDLIEIDADIAASVRIRGMLGDDQVMLRGVETSALRSFVFDGEGGNDTFTIDYQNGDPLPLPGNEFNFIGGSGTDNTFVIDAGGAQKTGFFVNTFTDAADVSVGNGRADSNGTLSDDQTTLRAAVQEANSISGTNYVFIPAGTYSLSVAGSGGDHQGDFDINNGHMIIVGTGAGLTIIDALTLSVRDRIFETLSAGSLDLSRVTLTGGLTTDRGGAIKLNNNTTTGVRELTLRDVAIVGNTANNSGTTTGFGGGIYVAPDASAWILRSVITDNSAEANSGGGGIYASGNTTAFASVLLEASLIANNSTSNGSGTDIRSVGTMPGTYTSNGGNMIGSTNSATFGTPGLQVSDYYDQSVDYVVTNLNDVFNHADDAAVVSLRDAIDTANTTSGAQTIWLPAWHFLLTDSGSGDFDIDTGHTIIVGSGAGATIIDGARLGTRDRIFETHTAGSLDLSRVTLTGGQTVNDGGAIRVKNNTTVGVRELTLHEVAIIGNEATNANGNGSGGGIYFEPDTEAHIIRSVISNNTAQSTPTGNGGGGIYAGGNSKVRLEQSVVAKNVATGGTGNDLRSVSGGMFTSFGGNLLTSVTGSNLATSGLLATDHLSQSVNYVVTDFRDTLFHSDDSVATSIREAIDTANTTAGAQTIWLPAWHFSLTRSGTDDTASAGDLDITSEVTIIGTGAGSTIIDAGGFNGIKDRVFDVRSSGELDLSRVTVTGGDVVPSGGGIRVEGTLLLSHSAVVRNQTTSVGAGIYNNSSSADTTILNSVIAYNHTTSEASTNGGAVYATNGTLEIGNSIIANNTAETLNENGAADLWGGVTVISSLGDNLLGDVRAALIAQTSIGNDYFGVPDYIVTGLNDSYNDTDNNVVMSIRDAIHQANITSGTEEIWLPAWDFVLTRDRETYGGGSPTDMDVSFGDLDIKQSLVIRGAGGSGDTSVEWRLGIVDKAFELLGDYTSDGNVNIADWIVWRDTLHSTTILAADGDDDGIVDDDDNGVWGAHFGNTFSLLNVTVV